MSAESSRSMDPHPISESSGDVRCSNYMDSVLKMDDHRGHLLSIDCNVSSNSNNNIGSKHES